MHKLTEFDALVKLLGPAFARGNAPGNFWARLLPGAMPHVVKKIAELRHNTGAIAGFNSPSAPCFVFALNASVQRVAERVGFCEALLGLVVLAATAAASLKL